MDRYTNCALLVALLTVVLSVKQSFAQSPVVGAVGKIIAEPFCPNFRCTDVLVKFSYLPRNSSCSGTFCYTITNQSPGFAIENFDIYGASFKKEAFHSNITGWVPEDGGALQFNGKLPSGNSATFCFDLDGQWVTRNGKLVINTNVSACSFAIPVPSASSPCSQSCILDFDIENAKCDTCPAFCGVPGAYYAESKRNCTLKVLRPAKPGVPCKSIVEDTCTKPCPVDCAVVGPFYPKVCSANCSTPTGVLTGFYVTETIPANDGRPCPTNTAPTTSCVMPVEKILNECGNNCVVDGFLGDPCPSACRLNGNVSTTALATYPTTLRNRTADGSPCPTVTTSCNCLNCELGPTPIFVPQCEAQCTKFDDSYAYANQVAEFPVTRSALPGGTCSTKKTKLCSTKCSCSFSSAYIAPSCTITTTIRTATPWAAIGFHSAFVYGEGPACNKETTTPCTSIITPTDCDYSVVCSQPKCSSTTGHDYTISTTATCSIKIIKSAKFGGTLCPITKPTTAYYSSCPGCHYHDPICECDYTGSALAAATGPMVYYGTKTCTYPRQTPALQGFQGATPSSFNCPVRVSSFTSEACSSTSTIPDCIYEVSSCGNCDYKSTVSGTPYSTLGSMTCAYTDVARPTASESTCKPTPRTRSCSSTLAPINCQLTSVCQPCTPLCRSTDSGAKVSSAPCTQLTYRSSEYGGSSCPSVLPTPTKTCSKICTPTVTPPCPGPKCECRNNAVVFGNATFIFSNIKGRLAIRDDAVLISAEVGKGINYPFPDCEKCTGLYVGGNLQFEGYVFTGKVIVGGECTEGDYSECDKKCNQKNTTCPCKELNFHFDKVYQRVQLFSDQLARIKSATTKFDTVLPPQISAIKWAGETVEVVSFPSNFTNPFQPIRAGSGLVKPGSTIVFNVYGKSILIDAIDFEFLRENSQYIVWNFVEATDIVVKRSKLYGGLILAPYAVLRGDGTIKGELYVKSIVASASGSIELSFQEYLGAEFLV